MEDTSSGIGPALLEKLKSLSRRGAYLHRLELAAEILSTVRGPRRAGPQSMTPEEVAAALAAGLIRDIGDGTLVLARRGAEAVRRARAGAAIAAARQRPTPEDVPPAPRSAARPGVNLKESPLGWLRQRRDRNGAPLISDAEFEAGERLRADFWFAQLTPRVTASWDASAGQAGRTRSSPGAGVDLADNVIAARDRVNRALSAVGPELSGMLVDVCCHLRGIEEAERGGGYPQRAGKVVLQLALQVLARHYGFHRPTPRRTHHWGAQGYRPAVDWSCDDTR